jgi:hypothetical protein
LFNIKWGIISGGGAFLISLILGGFSGAAFGYVLLRAGIFLLVFFVLGVGCNMLITSYLPELLMPEPPGGNDTLLSGLESPPGSRINITVGGPAALPEVSRGSGESEELGNIANLTHGAANAAEGMDQPPQNGYTDGGGVDLANFDQDIMGNADAPGSAESFEAAPVYSGPVFTASVDEGADVGALPDLGAMAGAFLTNAGDESPVVGEVMESPAEQSGGEPYVPARKPASGKTQALEGDFNPKELAAGIRTILSKDKQG